MIIRFFLFWLPMPFIAILKAGIREKIFTKFYNDLTCHQLSTLTLMILMSLYTWLIYPFLKIEQSGDTLITGISWFVLTILFEFFAGHYLFKNSWKRIFNDYNLLIGRVWGLFILFILILPFVVYSMKN